MALTFHEQQVQDAMDNETDMRNVRTEERPPLVGYGPRQLNALELKMLGSMVVRAYMIVTEYTSLEGVYNPRDEQDTALVRAMQDYDELYNLFADFHNALRTIWRRRGLKWMETEPPGSPTK